ncbi:MAG: hypothetical protein ACE5LU_00030 [Anaerolineae bacterium]
MLEFLTRLHRRYIPLQLAVSLVRDALLVLFAALVFRLVTVVLLMFDRVIPIAENGPSSLILPVVSWIRVASDLGFLVIYVMLVVAELIIFGARLRRQVIRELQEMENGN